jgi:hypothetical protein
MRGRRGGLQRPVGHADPRAMLTAILLELLADQLDPAAICLATGLQATDWWPALDPYRA